MRNVNNAERISKLLDYLKLDRNRRNDIFLMVLIVLCLRSWYPTLTAFLAFIKTESFHKLMKMTNGFKGLNIFNL